MIGQYKDDRSWSDRYIPTVKSIIGPHLLVTADDFTDQKQATDLVILTARDLKIACRVRRPGYGERYPFQFTIRAQRDNGIKTELAKIVDGWGDWIFYGHAADTDDSALSRWFIVNLASWRAHMIRTGKNGYKVLMGNQNNHDGTRFKWFDLTSFAPEPPILNAASHNVPNQFVKAAA